jgi:hypothetical protein
MKVFPQFFFASMPIQNFLFTGMALRFYCISHSLILFDALKISTNTFSYQFHQMVSWNETDHSLNRHYGKALPVLPLEL